MNFPYDLEAQKFYQLISDIIKYKKNDSIRSINTSSVFTKPNFVELSPQEVDNQKSFMFYRKKKNKVNKSDISPPSNFRILQHIGISGRNKIDIFLNENNNESLAMKEIMSEMYGSRFVSKTLNSLSDFRSIFIKSEI